MDVESADDMQLRLQLLGPPLVQVGKHPLEVDTRKATALLIYLAVTGEIQRRESLATLFWPESDAAHAKAALRRTLSALRKALAGQWLNSDRELVSLQADWLDCTVFAELVAATRTHDHPADQGCDLCIDPLTQAAELYRGNFLEGFTLPDSPDFDDWQYFHQLSYQRQLSEALQRLSTAHQDRGDFGLADEYANRLLSLDPLNEAAHRMLMWVYARSGRRQLALRQYQECVRVLQEELGAPPLDETFDLNERIKAGELEAVGREVTDGLASSGRSGEGTGLALATGGGWGAEGGELPLIGRERELAELHAWYQAVDHAPRVLFVEGELGVGKSRLVHEFIQTLPGAGVRTLQARCYPDEATYAYRPWVDALRSGLKSVEIEARLRPLPKTWLSEAARLLPELGQHYPQAQDPTQASSSTSGQDRFLESLAQIVAAMLHSTQPGLIYLDDLHWADEASLDLLTYLMRHGSDMQALVVAGWRTEGLVGEQQLRTFMRRLPQRRTGSIHLQRLDREQVSELASRAGLAKSVSEENLYRETEGLPFFVSEYIRAVQSMDRESEWGIPTSIRQAIETRLDALSGTGKQLLSTAAVIGRSFEFETLRMVSGRSQEETVAGIEELIGAGSIREFQSNSPTLGPSYDFTHEKLREVALETTTQARQRLLHARAAEALARLQGNRQTGMLAARIAHHLLRAGDEPAAAERYLQAAEHARSLYANEQALAHYRSALALGLADQAGLHLAIGDMLTLTGRYPEAVQNFEAAIALQPDQTTAGIEHKLGLVYERWGRWERAQTHLAAAAEAATTAAEQAHIYADWSLNAHRQGQQEPARQLIQRALEQAEAADDLRALAQAHNILGILARSQGDAVSAREQLQQSLEYAGRLSDLNMRSAALNNLALALAQDGQLEAALDAAREALEICQSLGDRHRAAALHSNLADLLHQTGDEQQARRHLTQSAELFAAVGVDSGGFEPEIWKLVEW